MGYESRLYVVEKSSIKHTINDKDFFWAEKIAEFNLCKTYVASEMRKAKDTNCYFYGEESEVVTDKYGETLKEMTIKEAIQILEEASAKEDYRRYAPCISLLKGFDETQWKDLVVLHYGY